jgi:hypothetical protein
MTGQETPVDDHDAATAYVPGAVIPAFCDGNTWAACFGLSWADMMLYDQAGPQRMIRSGGQYLRKVCGTMGVAEGRNEIVRAFLQADAEWLFMVDTDMGYAPDTVDALIGSALDNDTPIVGALCFAAIQDPDMPTAPMHGEYRRIQPTLYSYAEIPDTGERGFRPIFSYRRDAFQPVGATGAACILIHREALEAIGADPFRPITDATAGGNGTSRTFSEDISFCIRAAAADLPIGVDTRIKTTHHKGGIFLDEVAFAQQQEREIIRQAQARQRSPLGLPVEVAR